MRRKPRVPNIKFPYHRALKAYAYAGKALSFALEQLSYMDLEVPSKTDPSHDVIYRSCNAQFLAYRREGKKISRDLTFTLAQREAAGVEPFFSWIDEDGDPTSNEARFMDQVIDAMRNFDLRRRVSVSLFVGAPPEKISLDLKKSDVGINWLTSHIVTYQQFFWDIDRMGHEDRVGYAYIAKTSHKAAGGGSRSNRHLEYIRKLISNTSKSELLLQCDLPFEYAEVPDEETLKKKLIYRLDQALNNDDRIAVRAYSGALTRVIDATTDDSDEMTRELRETMAELQIIGSPTIAKRLDVDIDDLGHIEPVSRSSLEGEFSNPRKMGKGPEPREHGP